MPTLKVGERYTFRYDLGIRVETITGTVVLLPEGSASGAVRVWTDRGYRHLAKSKMKKVTSANAGKKAKPRKKPKKKKA